MSANPTPDRRRSLAMKDRTHCPAGHPLSGDNLVKWQMKNMNTRHCLTCEKERAKRRAAALAKAPKLLGISRTQYIKEYGSGIVTAEAVIAELERQRTDDS